jgi:DNA (cytosine-5)-methyltransferase 1
MTKFKEWTNVSNVDVLVGGTPCQSFSVAGLRKGLDDPRGNLMLTYLAIADKYRPKWLVWENVPGVLSSNGGLDFASLLRGMGELGYGFAYRILDAQYFGVAQRRRRVFVVGYLGDWRRAAAVLFERDSLSGNPAPSREKGQGAASATRKSVASSRWPADISSTLDTTFGTKQGLEDQHVNAGCPMFVPAEMSTVQTLRAKRPGEGGMSHDHEHIVSVLSPALNTCSGANHAPDTKAYVVQPIAYNITFCDANGTRSDRPNGGLYVSETDVSSTMTKAGIGTNVAQPIGIFQDSEYGIAQYDTAGTLRAGRIPAHQMAVAFSAGNSANARSIGYTEEGTPPLRASASGSNQVPTMAQGMAVRRLTPVECERLQGFPDTYTDIKSKGKATPDGSRYKALGNSMAVPVMAWIGKRIQQVESFGTL